MIKKSLSVSGLLILSFLVVQFAWAHAVVSPKEVGVGKFQTFTLGIPSEKDNNTVGVRLLIPAGLENVTPNVKPGWKIAVVTEGEGSIAREIHWTGGIIPPDQRDEFLFSAKVPASEAKLAWKVYQTYQDGIVSWDQDPNAMQPKDSAGQPDFSKVGPFSVTTVIDDLQTDSPVNPNNKYNFLLIISIAALILSVAALAVGLKGKIG